jgi:hypothetical protein
MTQAHLGGHYNRTAMPITTFDFMVDRFNIKTIIDVGCGPAGMTLYGNYKGVHMLGIDGDTSIPARDYIHFHDYTHGPLELDQTFDLAWSTEFVEHVYDTYIPNFMPSYQKAKYVYCSAAPPGQGGYHHVNEQPLEYWYKVFDAYGFDPDFEFMEELRATSGDRLVTRNGMFFHNRNVVETVAREPFAIDYEALKNEVNVYFDIMGGKDTVFFDRW